MTHFKGDGYSSMVPDLHLENVTIESSCCLEGSECVFGWMGSEKNFGGREWKYRQRVHTYVERPKEWTVMDFLGEG